MGAGCRIAAPAGHRNAVPLLRRNTAPPHRQEVQPLVKRAAKWVLSVGIFVLATAIIFGTVQVLCAKQLVREWTIGPPVILGSGESRASSITADCLHFLNVGNADCILLESGGHFALIDSGWGPPAQGIRTQGEGTAAAVIAYLKKVGAVKLDWILATHYHYDHAGGFPEILADPGIEVSLAYFNYRTPTEAKLDFNAAAVYHRCLAAAQDAAVPIADVLPAEPIVFGNWTLRFFNRHNTGHGENDASVVTYIDNGLGTSALLGGDITNLFDLETHLAAQLGKEGLLPVTLMKTCHHGYAVSNSRKFVQAVSARLAVATNWLQKVWPNVAWNYVMAAHTALLSDVNEEGLIVILGSNGTLSLSGGNMPV
ncbi:MAG: MBL fold metallo-hydrolase [Oscillospiraceae bacterium]|nr:MBL fold metallo-hydrolase [Oscillospiraceae bacterium]